MSLNLTQKPLLMENFSLFEDINETLYAGDPEIRKWFLVRNNYMPFVLCILYALFVKVFGPMIMKNRQPMYLRNAMIVYNFFLVATYFISTAIVLYCITLIDSKVLCRRAAVTPGSYTYTMATCGWIVYLLKYIEFMDTVFFILRKKDHLITNLHVIHHFLLPLIGWFLLRTERSGFQTFPCLINACVHIVMYTYYGLAAMGPKVRKYLWWKRYLTIAQMVQFILIVTIVVVIMPLTGCTASKTSLLVDVLGALFFFALFYNFYQHTFKEKSAKVKDN